MSPDETPEDRRRRLSRERARERQLQLQQDAYLAKLHRQRRREQYLRLRNDPKRWQADLDKKAEWRRKRQAVRTPEQLKYESEQRRARYLRERAKLGKTVKPIGADASNNMRRLPGEPFKYWLNAFERYSGKHGAEHIGPALDIEVRRVFGILAGAPGIVVELVDRALSNCPVALEVDLPGRGLVTVWSISDLYPDERLDSRGRS